MVDVETDMIINRSVARVAGFSADPSNAPDWYVNIDSVEWLTEPVLQMGSKMEFKASFLRRRLRYTYEVVELVPNERLVMRTAQGPFPMETTYTWQALDHESTRMSLRNRGEPTGFSKFVAPIMASAIRRANQKDLIRLKEIVEAGSSGPGRLCPGGSPMRWGRRSSENG
ncbi:MAG TPA: SRPBCC family protein [Dermatophilaceae bacterium]